MRHGRRTQVVWLEQILVPKRGPSTAPPDGLFTKGQVNRAGALLLDLRRRAARDGAERAVEDSDEDRLEEAWEALTWWRSLHARPLSTVAANLRYHVANEDGHVNGRIEVTQRLKRMSTIVEKLGREQGNVTQMHDIGGVRALLPSQHHVYALTRRLRKTWTIVRVRDYIAEPKPSGYRAVHLIVHRRGYPIEVQLRTVLQDAWANAVEEAGRRTGTGLKFGHGGAEVLEALAATGDVLAQVDRGELGADDLRAALNAMRSLLEQAGARRKDP